MYAVPQKIQPKNESNSELISANRSAKNGITSAMMNAKIQVAARMPAQVAHPLTVCSVKCLEPSKIRKKRNRADTEA